MINKLLTPVKSIRTEHIPLLIVYLVVGLGGVASVTNTLFFKDVVTLTPVDLISLGIWVSLPWSIKLVFGVFVDHFKSRKTSILLGNLLSLIGGLVMIDHVTTQYVFSNVGEYAGLLISGLLGTMGIVIADIAADTLAVEVVGEGPERDKELGMMQVLSRLSLSIGALIGAAFTGLAAAELPMWIVYSTTGILLPFVSSIATYLTRLKTTHIPNFNFRIFYVGLGYGIICVAAGLLLGEWSQPTIFIAALIILGYLFRILFKDMPKDVIKTFLLSMLAIFLFRVVPGIGPAGQWYYIEVLNFDEMFLGKLSLVAAISSFVVLWALADSITNHSIFKTMVVLITLMTVLSLPDILVFYGIHEYLGISARSLILADTVALGPLGTLSMIPLGVIIARNAPPASRATYMAVTASFMNLALVGGDLLTKGLNQWFVVTRDNFTQLGNLMVASLIISTMLSLLGLVILYKGDK